LCVDPFFAESKTPAPNPCAVPEQKQLDFWVGEWDLTWPGQNAGEVGHGANNIKRILDGCVVQENFSGGDSMHLPGTSVSIFDTRTGTWKQTWVDNEGGYLDFVGEFKNGQMILQRAATRPDGTKTPAAHGLEKHHRQHPRLELGIVPRWRQDLAGQLADSLQAQGLVHTQRKAPNYLCNLVAPGSVAETFPLLQC
jgi:hypothetical protein